MINFLCECATAPPEARRRYLFRSTAYMAVFLAGIAIVAAAGSDLLGRNVAFAIAGVALIALVGALYEFVVLIRALDELQRGIHITALAVGCGATAALYTFAGFAHELMGRPEFDPIYALPAAALGYYGSVQFVASRFR